MKRYLSFVFALLMLVTFTACSGGGGDLAATGSEMTSTDITDLYPPEQPDYNSEAIFDNIDSNLPMQDVIDAVDSANPESSKTDSDESSSKTSSKAPSKSESSSKASSAVSSKAENTAKPTKSPSDELRAVWISYLDFEAMIKGKSSTAAKAAIDKAFDTAKGMGLNAVIVQVRPFADAMYQSSVFPWSRVLTGKQGSDPGYDPLKYMVSSAHAKGLEIHAWINPYRILTSTDVSKLSSDHIARQWYNDKDDYVVAVDSKGLFFNPARDDVIELIVDGVTEIVQNYDVDGIHYDDYFYPTTASAFDKKAYNEYTSGGGTKSLANWRLANVNKLIKETYSAVKAANSSVQFGVSPQGNIELDYSSQYADVKTWCSQSGYIDYIMPQVYFGFNNTECPYSATVKEWNSMVTAPGVKLYVGLSASKIGAADKWAGDGANEWIESSDILMRQVSKGRELSRYGGFSLYRYYSIAAPSASVKGAVKTEMENLKTMLT